MQVIRVLGLFALALGFAALACESESASAQVKIPPQIKPPAPPPGGGPTPPPGTTPPGGVPMPVPPGGTGTNPQPGPGTTPKTGGSTAAPGAKRDFGTFPKEINGKKVEECVKEMRTNPDPVVRESAVRTLPLYGPIGREKGAEALVYALTKDLDLNVKLTAMSVAPTVLAAFAEGPDQPLSDGLTAFMNYLEDGSSQIRYEAVLAITAVGPYMKKEKPNVVERLKYKSKDAYNWQLRRAAIGALASVGQGSPPNANGNKGFDPDKLAVTALLDVLKNDTSALVRRTAIDALLAVGPVGGSQLGEWHKALDSVLKSEKEKVNVLWVRVLILRNDPNGVKGNEAHLNAVADALKADEPFMRVEGCQALGILGEEAKVKLDGLLDLVKDLKQPPEVVAAAMMAVTAMKSQDQIIRPVLQDVAEKNLNADLRKLAGQAIFALLKK